MFFIMQVGGYVFRLNNVTGETWVYSSGDGLWKRVSEKG